MATAARILEERETASRPRFRLVDERAERRAAPLVSYRTCTRCGERAAFVREDDAGWYACSSCGPYG